MALIFPGTRYPLAPPVEGFEIEEPVDGDQGIALTEMTNHLLYWRGRRATHRIYQYDAATVNIRNQDPSSIGAGVTLAPIWWKTADHDKHVWLSIFYQASPGATGGACVIDAELKTKTAGTNLDEPAPGTAAGIRWSRLAGTLPAVRRLIQHTAVTGIPVYDFPILRVDTGESVDDAPAGAYPTIPRPLNLGAAGAGVWVRLDLTVTAVRILAVDVWALFERSREV